MSATETTVLIRAFNEEKHIGALFEALAEQEYRDFEILLVDSGSTDRTIAIAEPHCRQIVHIDSRDFTFGYSLNAGCRHSRGQYIVIISAHACPVRHDWLRTILAPFADERVAMVYGRHIGSAETKFSERVDFQRLFGEAPHRHPPVDGYANNANSAICKAFWERHPFDEYLTGLEDIAWARYHAQLGYEIVYEPAAAVYHIHEESWHQVYNRYRREAVAARRIGLPRPPHGDRRVSALCLQMLSDVATGLPAVTPDRVKEIVRFRYHQWRGSADGWRQDIDLDQARYDLYYSGANQGVVISSQHHADLRDIPMPEVKPGDVLIKVAYVGVCRTDLEIYDGSLGYYKHGVASYPIVPGHEFCGRIVQAGANCGGLQLGDLVVGECILSCGVCELCRAGAHTACAKRREVGVMNYNGAYARFVAIPASHVHRIPPEVPLQSACLAEPLAVVRKGIQRIVGRFRDGGSRCAVIGAGPIGNLTAQALRMYGQPVTVFDLHRHRLEHLRGIAETEDKLRHLASFDVVVEATGDASVLRTVLGATRTDATLLLLGFPYGDFSFNFEQVVAHEKFIVGSVGSGHADFEWALEALPGIDSRAFRDAVLPLREFPEAWRAQRSHQHLKVMLKADEP